MRQAIAQNLKCLMLTAPGERIMDPEFGVGLKKYLFQNYGPEVVNNIKVNIRQQVKQYMPFVSIRSEYSIWRFFDRKPRFQYTKQNVHLGIQYIVQSVGISDVLNITLCRNNKH